MPGKGRILGAGSTDTIIYSMASLENPYFLVVKSKLEDEGEIIIVSAHNRMPFHLPITGPRTVMSAAASVTAFSGAS
jgi:hypothetical protein